MTKPIFLVGLPLGTSIDKNRKAQKNLEQKLDQYYVVFHQTNKNETEFKCFFEKDFDDVKFEELKQIVIDAAK